MTQPLPIGPSQALARDADLTQHEPALLAMLYELKQLQTEFKLTNDFNVFDAVGMQRQEIRHSRFLAYLLDPRNPHGLGPDFLRAVLALAVAGKPSFSISSLDVEIANLDACTVYCERDHFDISVEVPSLSLLFVIENKVDAMQSEDQLETYRKTAESRYKDFSFLGTFLTVTGYAGDDKEWSAIGYGDVIAALKSASQLAALPSDVEVAVRHYIGLVERNIVASQALIDACKKLYKQHRTAIELVITHGQQSALKEAFETFAVGKSIVSQSVRSTTAYFLFKSWEDLPGKPLADKSAWPSTVPVLIWFELLSDKMLLRLEVGPFGGNDGERSRAAVVKHLRDAYDLKEGAKDVGKATFTRITKWHEPIKDDAYSADAQTLAKVMAALWSKAQPDEIERRVIEAFKAAAPQTA